MVLNSRPPGTDNGCADDQSPGQFASEKISTSDNYLYHRRIPRRVAIMGKARDWSAFLSEESKAREESPLKAIVHYLTIPDMISLGGGFIH
jgi:hypothetical protein